MSLGIKLQRTESFYVSASICLVIFVKTPNGNRGNNWKHFIVYTRVVCVTAWPFVDRLWRPTQLVDRISSSVRISVLGVDSEILMNNTIQCCFEDDFVLMPWQII